MNERGSAAICRAPYMKKGISVQLFTALVILCITTVLGGVLAWQNYRSVKNILLTAAGETVQLLSQRLDAQRQWLVNPPLHLLQLMTYSPVTQASTLAQRVEHLPQFVATLKANEMLSALYVGYPNGEFVLVRKLHNPMAKAYFAAPENSDYLLQSVTLNSDGSFLGEWRYYDADLNVIKGGPKNDYEFDPRTRPWFTQALEHSQSEVTSPYIFHTTGQVGFTISQRGASNQAVVGMDISLYALNSQLENLMITEHTEVALIDSDGTVIAYPQQAALYVPQDTTDNVTLPHIRDVGAASIFQIFNSPPANGEPTLYRINGRAWYGMQSPSIAFDGKSSHLIVSVPAAELLQEAYQEFIRELVWIAAISLLLLATGWVVSQHISRPLRALTEQVRARSEFDYRSPLHTPSFITEIRELNDVLNNMSRTIDDFQGIALALNHGTKLDRMLEAVVQKLVDAFKVESGAVYLVQPDTDMLKLATSTGEHALAPEIALNGRDNSLDEGFYNALDEPDKCLHIPLKNHKQALQGVLVLKLNRHQQYTGEAERTFRRFVNELSGAAAVAIETRQLIEAHRQLLDAIIKLLANAIDAKSPYTGAHCERVPILAEALIHKVIESDQGRYADFKMDESQLYEFRLAAWLHDCGKVSTPESVMDKATKLETRYNRIHEIRTRFEVLWRDAEIAYWQGVAQGGDPETLRHTLLRRQGSLQDEFAFVANANIGREWMDSDDIDRLKHIGARRWWRHFDNTLGLGRHERARLENGNRPLPVEEFLLADRSDHIVPWDDRIPPVSKDDPGNIWGFDMQVPRYANNYGELYNLSISQGTLTPEERFKINEHIVQTIIMLNSLPLPDDLKRVPDIAGTHHEKMDGTGYPRGLDHTGLGIPERVMMIADIFEALTAADRPYNEPKTLSESLRIMARMASTGHIDPDMFSLFLTSGLYREYGERFLKPSQLDDVDVQEMLMSIGEATA